MSPILTIIIIAVCVLAAILSGFTGNKFYEAWDNMEGSESLSPLGKAIWAGGFAGYLFALLLLLIGSTVLISAISEPSSKSASDSSAYFYDIQAQCKSVKGVFNDSMSSPACYLDGERVFDNEHNSVSNDNISNDGGNTTKGGK